MAGRETKKRAAPRTKGSGRRSPGERLGDIGELYPDSTIQKLCADYAIPYSKRAELIDFLAFAATIYFNIKSGHDGKPSRARQRKHLREIAALAQKLSRKIEKLDDLAHRALWAAHGVSGDPRGDQQGGKTELGLTIHREELGEGKHRLLFMDERDIVEAVTVLGNYARYAAKGLPTARHGAKRDYALHIWMANAFAFWEQRLERPFTYDAQAGEPVSNAFRFCCDALRPVAPNIPVSTIGTYMRRAIQQHRTRAGKIPDQK